jgi:hypothetical protein
MPPGESGRTALFPSSAPGAFIAHQAPVREPIHDSSIPFATALYLTSFSDIIGRTPTPSVGPSNAAAPYARSGGDVSG